MSNIAFLIRKPSYLLSLLSSKYSDIHEEYENLNFDCLLFDKPSHILISYKEMQYSDHTTEFLKRFYTNEESNDRVPRLAIYYKNYHIFFCRPVFTSAKITILMHHYGDKKAELFYKHNYGNGQERHSESQCESSNTSISTMNNKTDINTIFNKTTRNQIDLTTMVFNNTNISNSIQGSELYTKRSKNDSLTNILVDMKVIKPPPSYAKRYNRNYKQHNGLSLKGSLCTLTKTKENSNCSDINKFLLSPKYKPYLSNFKSNLIEFKKCKPEIANGSNNNCGNSKSINTNNITNNKAMTTSTRIPSTGNKFLSHKTSICKWKGINNKTYDSNHLIIKGKRGNYNQNTITNFSQVNTIRNGGNCYGNNININFMQSTSTKSKSCKNTIAHFIHELGKRGGGSSTYTNIISNTKQKQKEKHDNNNNNINNNVQSQRSTSKNIAIRSSGKNNSNTINHKNTYNINLSNHKPQHNNNVKVVNEIQCNSNSLSNTKTYNNRNNSTRTHSNQKNNNNHTYNTKNINNNIQTHHTKIATSLKKSKVQIYMNYNNSVSRNKKNESYSSTFSKNKTQMTNNNNNNNCLGLTATCKGNSSIDTRETKRTQLKSILHELAKGGENQSHLAKKLDQLIKGSTSEWIRKKRREDDVRRENSKKENFNSNNNTNSSNTRRNLSNRGNSTSKSESMHPHRCMKKTSELHIQVNTRQPSLNSPHNRNMSRILSP